MVWIASSRDKYCSREVSMAKRSYRVDLLKKARLTVEQKRRLLLKLMMAKKEQQNDISHNT